MNGFRRKAIPLSFWVFLAAAHQTALLSPQYRGGRYLRPTFTISILRTKAGSFLSYIGFTYNYNANAYILPYSTTLHSVVSC